MQLDIVPPRCGLGSATEVTFDGCAYESSYLLQWTQITQRRTIGILCRFMQADRLANADERHTKQFMRIIMPNELNTSPVDPNGRTVGNPSSLRCGWAVRQIFFPQTSELVNAQTLQALVGSAANPQRVSNLKPHRDCGRRCSGKPHHVSSEFHPAPVCSSRAVEKHG